MNAYAQFSPRSLSDPDDLLLRGALGSVAVVTGNVPATMMALVSPSVQHHFVDTLESWGSDLIKIFRTVLMYVLYVATGPVLMYLWHHLSHSRRSGSLPTARIKDSIQILPTEDHCGATEADTELEEIIKASFSLWRKMYMDTYTINEMVNILKGVGWPIGSTGRLKKKDYAAMCARMDLGTSIDFDVK